MPRCLYGHCLLLSHSSFLVVLIPPAMILSIEPLLVSGDYGTRFTVGYLGEEFLYSF